MSWHLIDTDAALRKLAKAIDKHNPSVIAVDTETCGPIQQWIKDRKKRKFVDAITAKIVGMSISFGKHSVYISINHANDKNVDYETFKKFLVWLFAREARFVAHNWTYDLRVFYNILGYYPKFHKIADTILLAFMTGMGIPYWDNGELKYRYGLKELVEKHLWHKMTTYEEVIGQRAHLVKGVTLEQFTAALLDTPKELRAESPTLTNESENAVIRKLRELIQSTVWRDIQINETSSKESGEYAASDTRFTLKLFELFWGKALEMNQEALHEAVMCPFIYVLNDLNHNGLLFDTQKLEDLATAITPRVQDLEKEFEALTKFSIRSPAQVAKYCFEDSKCWPIELASKTKNGALSVKKHTITTILRTLEPTSYGYHLARIKQEHAKLFKLVTAYTGQYTAQVPYRADGRVRSSFKFGPATGRLSSSNPPFQTFPKDNEELAAEGIPNVRDSIIASPGHIICGADWRQLEVLVMAHVSKDAALIKAINEGIDLHTWTAEHTGHPRTSCKTARFAWQYGGRAKAIAQNARIPLEDAKKLVESLDSMHAGVIQYRKEIAAFCSIYGYVETLMGRRAYIDDIGSDVWKERAGAERQAANYPIQGGAADIAMYAGGLMYNSFITNKMEAKIICQVHDEYVVECPKDEEKDVLRIMRESMEAYDGLCVPLTATIGSGLTWAEAKA